MDPQDAPDLMEQGREDDAFKRKAAILIAVFAMLLAITGLGGSNSMKDALLGNVEASNAFNFFQAKNMRQTSYELAADQIESVWLNDPALPEATRARRSRASSNNIRRQLRAMNPSPRPGRARRS
jgi:hypothetical protein